MGSKRVVSPWRSRLVKGLALLALLVIFAASLGFLELLVRLATTHSLKPLGTFPNTLYEFDPRVGVRHRPNDRFVVRQRDFQAVLETNAQGFRSSVDFGPPQDRPVIALLGDSITQAIQVDETETFAARLQERLPAVAQNYGVSGHGTANSLAVYRHFARPNQPAVVILITVHNDPRNCSPELEGNFAMSWKPAYRFDDAEQPIELLDFIVPSGQAMSRLKGTGLGARVYHVLHEAKAQCATYHLLSAIRAQRGAVEQGFPKDWLILEDPWPPELARAVELMRWCLTQLAREVAADGAKLIVTHVPVAAEADDERWAEVKAQHDETLGGTLERQRVSRAVQEMTDQAGATYVDCFEAFRAAAAAGLESWLPIDGHLTPAGHALLAEQLAPAVQAALAETAAGRP